MSYMVFDFSKECVKHWIKLYDFPNMDYGSEELNNFAKTLREDWFVTYHFPQRQGFTNKTEVTFKFKNQDNPVWEVVDWHPKDQNKQETYFIRSGDKRGPSLRTDDPIKFAEYLYSLWTPEVMAKRFRPRLEEEMPKILEERRVRKEKEEREEYLSHPERWTSEEKVDEWLRAIASYDPYYEYSDDYRVWEAGSRAQHTKWEMEKLFTKEDWELAKKKYEEKYKRPYKED